ncbi:MAG: patatin-like phospholipase family protein [Treponema sp.]|nr:patatin-like phospholipase family protein [Treponema sp.]
MEKVEEESKKETKNKKKVKLWLIILIVVSVLTLASCATAVFFVMAQKNKKNIGIVFSGGGAKGAYEIGVWKAMEEAGISNNVKAISGTSVGALNAVLVSTLNAKESENLWNDDIFFKTILTPDELLLEKAVDGVKHTVKEIAEKGIKATLFDLAFKGVDYVVDFIGDENTAGLCSRDNLENLISQKVDVSVIKDKSSPDIYISCVQKKNGGTLHVFSLKEQTDENIIPIMMASSAIPGVFPSVTLSDVKENGVVIAPDEYIDGGTPGFGGNNTNIKPLLKDEKIETIFVVFLKDRSGMEISSVHKNAQEQMLLDYQKAISDIENEYETALLELGETKKTDNEDLRFWNLKTKTLNEVDYLSEKIRLHDEMKMKKNAIPNPKKTEEWSLLDEQYKYDVAFERKDIYDIISDDESAGKKVIPVVPSVDLGNFVTGTLNFDKEKLKSLIYLGYSDTLEILKANGYMKITE